MAEPKAAAARSGPLGWGLIAAGLAIAALATWSGPRWVVATGVESPMTQVALVYIGIFLPMAVVAVAFARIERFSPLPAGAAPGSWGAIGLASGIGGLAIAVAYAAIAGSLVEGSAAAPALGGLALGLLFILFQTGTEELLFRGWLQRSLQNKLGIGAALAISAVLFSAFHMLAGAHAPMALVNLLLGGVWFGLLAWRSGGLIAPIAAHFGWNVSEDLVAGLVPNPGTGSFGAMMDWDLAGPAIWGGSEEGLNTSIAMTIVLLALIVPLAWPRGAATAPAVPAPRRPGPAAG